LFGLLPVFREARETDRSTKEAIIMRKGIGVLLIAAALLALVLLAACGSDSSASPEDSTSGASSEPSSSAHSLAAASQADNSQAQGLSVSGEGRVSAEPDVAVLGLGVSVKAASVEEANGQAQEAMSDLLDSLEANGVQEKDIQTSQFSVYPEYDYRNNEQILTGYRVTHMLQVKVRDIDKAGEVIDDAVEAGGDLLQVQSISFTIDDTTALSSEARAEAVADAQTKAEELATLAGVSLGKPTYISESISTPYPQPYYDRGGVYAMEEAAVSEISTGELEVVVSVYMTYTIE
jgi:uncharacterized protein YggE